MVTLIDLSKMSAEDRLIRARIQINKNSPFFSYLVMNLNFKREDGIGSIGVNREAILAYNEEWVKSCSEAELEGILAHEICHPVFRHFDRLKSRDKRIFNIACDIAVNNILVNNGFILKENGLVPHNNRLVIKDPMTKKPIVELDDLDDKEAEQIYLLIYKDMKKMLSKRKSQGEGQGEDGEGENSPYESDVHIYEGKEKDNLKDKGTSKGKQENIQKDWNKVLAQASAYAKQAGKMPSGIDRSIDGLLNPKQSYKELLYRYITNEIASDYSWSMPHKKSYSMGIYLPHMKKELIEMVTVIDTSGSIDSENDLKQFLTEIVTISKSFNSIRMTVITCDSKVHNVYEVNNGDIDKIMSLQLQGGGGTAFNPAFDWIRENKPNNRLVIYFTDGCNSDGKPDTSGFNVIWLLSKHSTTENIDGSGTILKIDLGN